MSTSWKEKLQDKIPEDLGAEIDTFEAQIEQKKQGQIDDRVFAETRLRRGVYGQRYDNGQRFDGRITKPLQYPSGDLFKGPDTVWDAPGMQRIKIPYGILNPEQPNMPSLKLATRMAGCLGVTLQELLDFLIDLGKPD